MHAESACRQRAPSRATPPAAWGVGKHVNVLVLSCSTGQGHNDAAAAIAEEFHARGVSCASDDVMVFAHNAATAGIVKDTYDNIVLNHPQTFKRLFQIGQHISSPRRRSPVYFANSKYADNLAAYIESRGIDTVVCTHMFPAQALTALIEKGLRVKSFVVTTDYLCLPFWEECRVDRFIVAHEDVVREFERRGIAGEKIVPLGLPIAQKFRQNVPAAQARAELGLDPEAVIYLILTGSMGFGRSEDLPRLLLQGDESAQVVFVAGRNRELLETLERTYGDDPRFLAMGFTDRINRYMDAADTVLSKPGGLTSTEVAAKRKPLVHTPAIPGFEMRNAAFFSQRGMSVRTNDYDQAAREAVYLAHHAEDREAMAEAQAENIDPFAVCRICDYIAEEAD